MRIRTHPGEVLHEEYLAPLGMSATALAEELRVPANRITEIVRGHRGVTADTALRLAAYFDTTPQFWMDLQTEHDISKIEWSPAVQRAVAEIAEILRPAAKTTAAEKKIAKKLLTRSKRKKRSKKVAVTMAKRTGTNG